MAGETPDLHVTVRTGTGKGAARQARREGNVPGIVYGGEAEPLPIGIPFNVLMKRLKQGRFLSTLFNLKVDGHEDVRVICRDVQRDVVRDLPIHLDLLRLQRNTQINLDIPVEFTNEDTWGDEGYLADKGLIPLPAADRVSVSKSASALTPLAF